MINILIYSLFMLNIMLTGYFSLITFIHASKVANRTPFNVDFSAFQKYIENEKSWIKRNIARILFGFVIFFTGLFFLALGTSPIWIPVLLGVLFDAVVSLVVLIIMSMIFTILKIKVIRLKTKDWKYVEIALVSESAYYFSILYIMYFLSDLNGMDFYLLLEGIYETNFELKHTLMVLIPVLVFSYLFGNLYLLIKRFKLFISKDISKYQRINKNSLVSILVIAGYFGLLYINEMTFDYVTTESVIKIQGSIDLFTLLLTAILIPSLINGYKEKSAKKKKPVINDRRAVYVRRKIGR